MAECKACGEEVDELQTVVVGGKKKKMCEKKKRCFWMLMRGPVKVEKKKAKQDKKNEMKPTIMELFMQLGT